MPLNIYLSTFVLSIIIMTRNICYTQTTKKIISICGIAVVFAFSSIYVKIDMSVIGFNGKFKHSDKSIFILYIHGLSSFFIVHRYICINRSLSENLHFNN